MTNLFTGTLLPLQYQCSCDKYVARTWKELYSKCFLKVKLQNNINLPKNDLNTPSKTISMRTRHGDQCISKVQPELTQVFIRENVMPLCVLQNGYVYGSA